MPPNSDYVTDALVMANLISGHWPNLGNDVLGEITSLCVAVESKKDYFEALQDIEELLAEQGIAVSELVQLLDINELAC